MAFSFDKIATTFSHAGHSVDLINTLSAKDTLSSEQKEITERNVLHLEAIKNFLHDDGSSIWTDSYDFTAIDAAIALGKTKYE
tara:strand:- start:274 stop:522 length:249 start_codon:yes stop_codon:yes gene_type:complete